MKTTILLTILFIMPTIVRAQADDLPRHEVSFDLGCGTFNGDVKFGCGGYEEPEPSTPLEQYRSMKYHNKNRFFTPSYNMQYHYNFRLGVTPVAIGTTLAYQQEEQQRRDTDYYGITESRHANYINIMFSARLYALYRERIKIYAELYVGHGHYWEYGFDDNRKSSSLTTYHATFFGISAGKKLFGYGEFGLGYLGVLRAGIGYRF